ncbi:hypothetical protein [Catenovulum sediminis]|uniref:Minor capsid protein n=1 Tax=Catenovulum sediminis TaxID=1740262 RepID=A0ABV1RKA2_9ALTE|nr:hypothetical protein [Catenovulum sediminis]
MIEKSIRDFLISKPELLNVATGGVYLDRNHSASDNYIQIDVTFNNFEYSNHGEQSQIDSDLQITCFSSDKATVKNMEKELKKAINLASFKDEYASVQSIYKQSSIPDYEDDTRLYSETCNYLLYYNEV